MKGKRRDFDIFSFPKFFRTTPGWREGEEAPRGKNRKKGTDKRM